jgi:hypothetical protein
MQDGFIFCITQTFGNEENLEIILQSKFGFGSTQFIKVQTDII